MSKTFIKVSSVTNAQRAQKILRENGLTSYIERSSARKNGEGCGYAVIVKSNEEQALELIRENGIRIVGVDKS